MYDWEVIFSGFVITAFLFNVFWAIDIRLSNPDLAFAIIVLSFEISLVIIGLFFYFHRKSKKVSD